jgi:hypothetical protein
MIRKATILVATVVALAAIAVSQRPSEARVKAEGTTYSFSVDAAAAAPSGHTISMIGDGVITIRPNQPFNIDGGGLWVHQDAQGNVIEVGEWEAEFMYGFTPYGSTGGKAVIFAHMIDTGGVEGPHLDGVLTLVSTAGNSPAGAVQGLKLSFPGTANFNKSLGGDVEFNLVP